MAVEKASREEILGKSRGYKKSAVGKQWRLRNRPSNREGEWQSRGRQSIKKEMLKKIDEVFKMVSEIYRNGPTKGLSQISLREQTPPLKRRSVSISSIWGKSTKLASSIPIRFLPLGDIDRTTKESTTDEGIDICVDLWVRGGL